MAAYLNEQARSGCHRDALQNESTHVARRTQGRTDMLGSGTMLGSSIQQARWSSAIVGFVWAPDPSPDAGLGRMAGRP
jgi:hypothetical protein